MPSPQCWTKLRQRGLLARDGLFTPAAVRAYVDAPPPGFPALTFYAADVGPGDGIYVPWWWRTRCTIPASASRSAASLRVTREFRRRVAVLPDDARFRTGACVEDADRHAGGPHILQALGRADGARDRPLATGRSTAPLRALMRLAMKTRAGQARRRNACARLARAHRMFYRSRAARVRAHTTCET